MFVIRFVVGLYMPLYSVWSLRKCGKERKFSFIDGKVFVFFGWLGVGDIV